MCANLDPERAVAHEGYIPIDHASLYYRDVGRGEPVIVLHGGPDFGHSYLLPAMDRLAGAFRLIYYAQRGRGMSAANVRPEGVTMESEMADLERVMRYFGLESAALLGHSFGGLLAMEYAIRHPERVSRLILMNSAPSSRDDFLLFREERRKKTPGDVEKLQAMQLTPEYEASDPDAVAAYYRVHYMGALRRPEQHLDTLVDTLRSSFTQEGIQKGRAIEDRLMEETWLQSGYDLLPKLNRLDIPTLVIHGDADFVPTVCSAHIAQAIPGARFALLEDCGHFSYLECPEATLAEMLGFFDNTSASRIPVE